MANEAAPLITSLSVTVPGVAVGATDSFAIGRAPVGGTVTGVSYLPDAASTGDAANKRVYTLVNKGASGAGTTVIGTLDLIAGVNLVAFDEKPFTLSVVANATTVAEGDVLAFVSTFAGTGLVDSGGTVKVDISRTAGA